MSDQNTHDHIRSRQPGYLAGSGRQIHTHQPMVQPHLSQPHTPFHSQSPPAGMYEQLTELVRDMKGVMRNFKVFFNKYLSNNENALGPYQPEQQHYQPNNSNIYYQQQPIVHYNAEDTQKYQDVKEEAQDAENMDVTMPIVKKKHNFGKKPKNPVDPNKPKAPLTPYFMFFQENRDILRKKYPQMTIAEIGALGGRIWKHLSEQERQTYRQRYEDQRSQYNDKMKVYKKSPQYFQAKFNLQASQRQHKEGQVTQTVDADFIL